MNGAWEEETQEHCEWVHEPGEHCASVSTASAATTGAGVAGYITYRAYTVPRLTRYTLRGVRFTMEVNANERPSVVIRSRQAA